MTKKKILFIVCTFLFFSSVLLDPIHIYKNEFPSYRVVLDPGHGGISLAPISQFGDRYSRVKNAYLDSYREGTSYRGIYEHVIVYEIAEKVYALLKKTQTSAGFRDFYEILQKYTKGAPAKIKITPFLSRPDSRNRSVMRAKADPNYHFRLFDAPAFNNSKETIPGRMSRINGYKPHLVVSLHCDYRAPLEHKGVTAVICPPFSLLEKGLHYLQGKHNDTQFFYNSSYSYWYIESVKRSAFSWFLNDASIYFTGYALDRYSRINHKNFRGYRHNMVSWNYADNVLWEKEAREHPSHSQYADTFAGYCARGRFWQRERSVYEKYRREGGLEGYGGDNCYASYEIIRYMLTALQKHGYHHREQFLGNSHYSVWSVPLYVNAIAAYIELGYLYQRRFRYLFTERQHEIAEGIAVGIYSLLAGLEPVPTDFEHRPRGKKIDLQKYMITDKKNYFDIVLSEKKRYEENKNK